MNCEQYQRRLLGALDPEDPPAEVAAHFTDCPACRAWQQQLVRIERHVPLLPAPASQGKAAFLARLLNEPDLVTRPPAPPVPRPFAWRPLAVSLMGVAATVALIVSGMLVVGSLSRLPPDKGNGPQAQATNKAQPTRREQPPLIQEPAVTLVARLTDCDLRLAQADTPRQRVQTLADLADALRDEAQLLGQAAAPEALETVALMYGKVVREGILERARTLPEAQRQEVLEPIAARLARVEHDVEAVARTASPTAAERLHRVALVAREGDAQLRALVRGGSR